MPNVGGKKFPYTKQGMKDAEEAKDKMGYQEGGKVKKKKKSDKKKTDRKKELKFSADDRGSITGKMDPNRKEVLDKIEANNSKPTPSMPTAKNNTMPPKPQAAPAKPAGMSAAPIPGTGGMLGQKQGMPPKQPPMMKKGGKVKKYNKGGKVRGAGIAKKGVRKCKMR